MQRDMEDEQKEKKVMPTRQIFNRICWLSIMSATFQSFAMCQGNILTPYLYSRVRCCEDGGSLGSEYDITHPRQVHRIQVAAAKEGLRVRVRYPEGHPDGLVGACDVPAFPRSSEWWSLSPGCVNKAFVEETAQTKMGWYVPLQQLAVLLVMPVGSAVSDTAGRRGVLLAYVFTCFLSCILFLIDSQITVMTAWRDALLFLAGMMFCAHWEPKDMVVFAGIADVMGHDEVNKSRANFINMAVRTVGTSSGFVAAWAIAQMCLESYGLVWLLHGVAAVAIGIQTATTVEETLPSELRTQCSWKKMNPVTGWLESINIVCQDKVLTMLALNDVLFGFTWTGFLSQVMSSLVDIGYSTSKALLPGILCTAMEVFYGLVMVQLIPEVGIYNSCIIAHVAHIISYVFWGPLTLMWKNAPFIAVVFHGAGFAFYYPAKTTIVSQRVVAEHQGKCQAGLGIAFVCGAIVGAPVYSDYLFTGAAIGQRWALPAYVSLVISAVNVVITTCIAYTAKSCPPPHEVAQLPAAESMVLENGKAQGYGAVARSRQDSPMETRRT